MDQPIPLGSKFNTANTTTSLSHSSSSPTIEKGDLKQYDELTPISINDTSTQKTTSPQFSGRS
jgi:hypothetical protein